MPKLHRIARIFAVAIAAAAAVSPIATRGQAAPAGPLTKLIPRLMKDGDVPGLSLAVVRDGTIAWHAGFGVKNAETGGAVADDTIFEAASLSKPVFAYLVLKLVDAGKLDLDAPVSRYLPGDYVDDPRISAITVRRVLSHATGFPNWRPRGQELKIEFPPGERFSYSGEGFVYLQKAVENVTGQTLEALARRLVFEPLHMTDTSYSWQDRFEGRKATGHDAVGTPRPLRRPAEANAAASLHTTATDYARFVIAVLDGTGLRRVTVSEMLTPQVFVDTTCTNCIGKKPGPLSRELAWGLGVGLEKESDGITFWHWGDNGGSGFHCYFAGSPGRRDGVVVFTNSVGGHGIIPDIVATALPGPHPAFAWLDYEKWDSPARRWFKEILASGAAAAEKAGDTKLTEQQVNRVGYWLLGKKKMKEAIVVFEKNVRDHPDSWNVHDSLGEGLAEDGQKERAIASYEKSLALNPSSPSGAEALRKLRAKPAS